jgi:hypothetical protein
MVLSSEIRPAFVYGGDSTCRADGLLGARLCRSRLLHKGRVRRVWTA